MTKSVTLLFPGQGAQYVGMGKQLQGSPSYELFAKANQVLGYNLSNIMFEGPEDDLKLTQNTQPAIVSYSVALFQKLHTILNSKGVKIDRVLGHSVGEYAALVAAGSLSFEDAVKAVHFRGKYMQEAVPFGKGSMYAIMRVEADLIKQACIDASQPNSEVQAANYNEPGQTVISGEVEACKRAVKLLEERSGGKAKAMELKVSAPFHCTLMQPAREKLEQKFNEITFNPTKVAYIANIDAKEYSANCPASTVKQNLLEQVCGSVLWSQSIAKLSSDTLCVEVGPGRVLAGLVKKINPEIKVISLDKEDSWTELEGAL